MGYRWVVLAVGALAQGTNAAVFLGLPAITPQLREHFDLTLPQVGLLLGAVNLGTMLTLVAWGAVADRRGERLVMAVGGVGAAACLAVAALGGPVVAGLALVGVGLFGASVNAASGRAVMTWFPADRRGLAMGIRQTATPLGAALTAAVLPVVAVAAGVPTAFLALAGFTALVATAVAVLVREPPGAPRAAHGRGVVLTDRALIRLSAATGLLVVPQFTAAALMVELLHAHRGVTAGAAAGLFAVAQVLGGLGRLGVGAWSDRVRDRVGPLRTLSVVVAVAFAGCAALLRAPVCLLAAALVATAAVALCWNGVAVTAAAELAPEGSSGTALGVQNTANYLSATVTPALAGWVVVALGWPAALLLAAAGATAARLLLAPAFTPRHGAPTPPAGRPGPAGRGRRAG
ncbi:MFS transporter [Saccharothrix algeriensis]|uniref:MFS family permease n=1 Tax=Saccharothrix algeriensis TaxID=173560 RepID=A0A8T8HRT0_9PSEU|nr:MFS transporter [Saccharothrix algeriensis]MBM7812449.1 MFS family permease [Saccharothrix algeriensis]QTR01196.1 MFS transporter [Saccharothrix algeriensis]